MIEILSNGALNLVQDLGRPAHLHLGVSPSGAMDAPALRIANLLVGNDEGAAGIEICIFPFRVRFHADTWFACAGAATTLSLPRRDYRCGYAVLARAGDLLTVAPPPQGSRVLLALRGGLDLPLVMGSRATDLKSGFGGLDGRGLRKGDALALGAAPASATPRAVGVVPPSRLQLAEELAEGCIAVRAMAGAEFEAFTEDARQAFGSAEFKLTPDCNRQGYRLEGPPLKTARPLELLSHGLVAGTVQVPPAGQAIVQMAEANTCGGYPKIATVIEADLWRLAQLRPGQRARFTLVDHATAVQALRDQQAELARIRRGLALNAAGP